MMRTVMKQVGTAIAPCVALLACGCASVTDLLERSQIKTPTARIIDVRLRNLDLRSADLDFDVEISNPLAVGVPLVDLEYSLATSGPPFVQGSSNLSGSVPARGSRVVSLPVAIDLLEVVRLVSGLRPGGVMDYTASLTINLDLPGGARTGLPLRKEGKLPIPSAPSVSVSSITWEQLTLSRAHGVVTLDVENTNSFPFDLDTLTYSLSLAGRQVSEGRTASPKSFSAGGRAPLGIPIDISPIELGSAFFGVLQGENAEYDLEGALAVRSAFGPIQMSFGGSGRTGIRH